MNFQLKNLEEKKTLKLVVYWRKKNKKENYVNKGTCGLII